MIGATTAGVAKLVDARDLKSLGSKELCRFEPGRPHQCLSRSRTPGRPHSRRTAWFSALSSRFGYFPKHIRKFPAGRQQSRSAQSTKSCWPHLSTNLDDNTIRVSGSWPSVRRPFGISNLDRLYLLTQASRLD